MFYRILKIAGVILLIGLLAGTIATYKLNQYLTSNKTKVLDKLDFLPGATLSFEEVVGSWYENFPKATIILKKVILKDTFFTQQAPIFETEKLEIALSLHDLWNRKIAVQKVQCTNGNIHIYTDTSGVSNLDIALSGSSKPSNSTPKSKTFWTDFRLLKQPIDFSIINTQIALQSAYRQSNLQGIIQRLHTKLDPQQANLAAKIDVALAVKELAFSEKSGTFLKNSTVEGIFEVTQSDTAWQFLPFDLNINEEQFRANATIRTDTNLSLLVFEHSAAELKNIAPLLPRKIQKEIEPYEIARPFYAKASIQTDFQKGTAPVIEVDILLENQTVIVHQLPFKNTTLKGRFVNRIFDDERKWTEARKRFRIILENVNTKYQAFHIQTPRLLVYGTENQKPQLKTTAHITGNSNAISDWLDNEQFFFEDGRFDLTADVRGQLNSLNDILLKSEAMLDIHDFSVIYSPADVVFPFTAMNLRKDVGAAYFKITNHSFNPNHTLFMQGFLKNLPTLLVEMTQNSVSSEVNITTKKLTWTDFVNFFENYGMQKNKRAFDHEKMQTMKQTVRGVYRKFRPQLSIKIDTLAYFDLLQLDNFKTGLHFENEHTLVLDKTKFNYRGGEVIFNGKLDISQANQTPFEFELQTKNLNLAASLPSLDYLNISMLSNFENLPKALDLTISHKGIIDDKLGLMPNRSSGEIKFQINEGKDVKGRITYQPEANSDSATAFGKTQVHLEGNPKVFNTFFKTEQFFFKDGTFNVELEYNGNLGTIQEIISSGNASFTLKNSEVFYQPAGVTFPLSDLDLKLEADKAIFDFYLNSDALPDKVHLLGNINNLSELIIGETGKKIATDVEISAKKFNWVNLFDLLSDGKTDLIEDKSASMKTSISGLLQTFQPHFHVNIDSFIYSEKLAVANLIGGVYSKDATNIILEETEFDFKDGRILVNGAFDVSQKLMTPFTSNIQASNLSVYELIKSLNYLALPSIKKIDKLGGKVFMNFDLEGIIDDKGEGLIPNATKGHLSFDLRKIVLIGLEPLDNIATRLKVADRFEELRFAPIIGEVFINGQEIEFPLLEIQSNAIHLFMEGTLSYRDLTDIWVSIPLRNLRRRNRWVIPEKTGYAAARNKVYIEVTSDEQGENRFKFRFTKRKFYKKRGLLDQYRKDKRRYRAARRSLRASS